MNNTRKASTKHSHLNIKKNSSTYDYEIILTAEAENDIVKLRKSGDKIALKKLNTLVDELREHPTTGTGKPEQLKYNYTNCWSRKITDKHRLIYKIENEKIIVIILGAYGHHNDK